MLRLLFYAALILGLYFIFKFFLRLLLYIFVVSSKKKFENGFKNHGVRRNDDNTVTYKMKKESESEEIIEFEEE